jgi:hypothetical protein
MDRIAPNPRHRRMKRLAPDGDGESVALDIK